jgi:hypothetical protein
MKKEMPTEINPTIVNILEQIIFSLKFFKNYNCYQIAAINFPTHDLLTNHNINIVNCDIQECIVKFDLVIALYWGNEFHFLKFLSKIKSFGNDNSGIIVCGLLDSSCDALAVLGIADLKILSYQKILDHILNTGYIDPVISIDHLTLEYNNYELLITDLKLFFAETGLVELLDQNIDFLKNKFNQYLQSHQVFSLNLGFYIACAFKKPLVNKTENIAVSPMFFREIKK